MGLVPEGARVIFGFDLGLIAGGFLLAKGESLGRPLSFICADALVFLGLLVFNFGLLNGLLSHDECANRHSNKCIAGHFGNGNFSGS
jgi:hypothetical protein